MGKYKYVRYVIDDAELVLAPDAALPGARGVACADPRQTPVVLDVEEVLRAGRGGGVHA